MVVKGIHVDWKDSDDDTTMHETRSPIPYVKFSSQVVPLESAAAACGNGDFVRSL